MHKINILSDEITNKIAAGEVVQRPLSVVKELIENSIDAKSSFIKIDLSNSGIDEIKITDNGIGLDKKNLKLSVIRHATSKVLTEEDIYKIATLGFRGEALSSIAAVSKLSIISSTDGTKGYKLYFTDNKVVIVDHASNKGSEITVSNLFYNTPARFKHLSSTFYELSLIIKYVNKISLTNPKINFSLYNNDSLLFSTIGDGEIKNIFLKIYSKNVAKNLISFRKKNEHFNVDFHIVKADETRSRKDHIHIAVNDRIIKNINIENMIIQAYGKFLHTNQYPIVFINIKCDYSLVDINIHPTKEQIKISMLDKLEFLITEGIKQELMQEEYISYPTYENIKVENHLTKDEDNALNDLFSKEQIELNYSNNEKNEDTKIHNILEEENSTYIPQKKHNIIPGAKFLCFFHLTYILFENEKGLFLIDQHAAQERIRYEMIYQQFKSRNFIFNKMLIPTLLEFSAQEYSKVIKKLDNLKELGIILEEFGLNTLRVTEVDSWYMKLKKPKIDILNIINLTLESEKITYESYLEDLIIMMACRSSIKANQYITENDASALLEQLNQCEVPYTCPHGRPIIISLTPYEIEKMFKRIS